MVNCNLENTCLVDKVKGNWVVDEKSWGPSTPPVVDYIMKGRCEAKFRKSLDRYRGNCAEVCDVCAKRLGLIW